MAGTIDPAVDGNAGKLWKTLSPGGLPIKEEEALNIYDIDSKKPADWRVELPQDLRRGNVRTNAMEAAAHGSWWGRMWDRTPREHRARARSSHVRLGRDRESSHARARVVLSRREPNAHKHTTERGTHERNGWS
jgi:hypothetical protein